MCDPADVVGIIRDIVATAAAATAGIVAVVGLNAWRRQYSAKINHEQARRLLKELYAARDMVNFIRSPFISAGEFVEARQAAGEEEPKNMTTGSTDHDVALVYQRRWQLASESFRSFEAELVEAEVLWGDSAKEAAESFRHSVRDLRINIELYLRAKIGRWWERSQDSERIEKYEKVIYKISDSPDEDEFSRKVNDAVSSLESFLRLYLKL